MALRRFRMIILMCAALAPAGLAHAFDLNGAWATDPDQCSKIFEKKGDAIVFTDASDLYGSGFVIDGNKIVGKTAKCTIDTTKPDGAMLHFLASCATDIMFQKIPFSLKIVDDNRITRLFPGMPDIAITYSRCP